MCPACEIVSAEIKDETPGLGVLDEPYSAKSAVPAYVDFRGAGLADYEASAKTPATGHGPWLQENSVELHKPTICTFIISYKRL